MFVLYLILYILALLGSVTLFLPDFLPSFVKWPVALLVVLLVVFIFNLPKKDSNYTTHETTKKIQNYGLFNPLIIYTAASIYVLGFTIIFSYLAQFELTNLVNVTEVFSHFEFNLENGLFCGLIFLVSAMLIYFIRNSFKNNACESSLKFRGFWYILLTLIVVIIGVFSFDSYSNFNLYDYLLVDYNIYVFFGLLALIIAIDITGKVIVHEYKVKKAKEASGELAIEREQKRLKKEEKRASRLVKKAEKREKIVAKEKARDEKIIAKEEAKLAKLEAKLVGKEVIETAPVEEALVAEEQPVEENATIETESVAE